MATAVHIVRETALRTWLKTLRRPVPLTFSFVQPLIWMLIFGFLFQRFALGEAYADLTYLDFLVPGICAMTVLFGASQAGIGFVRDLESGYLQRMARACTQPASILTGKVVAEVVRLLAQATIVGATGALVGAQLRVGAAALIGGGAVLALFAVAYASLSCWIALKSRFHESMAVFVHVVNMPLLFTSTALVPSRQMPPWLQEIAAWNPLTLVADGLRGAMLYNRAPDPVGALVPLALLAALLFGLTRLAVVRVADE